MKVALYLRNLDKVSSEQLSQLLACNLFFIVEGPDLQKSSHSEQLLTLKDKVTILSFPLEHGEEPLSAVLNDCVYNQFSHLVHIESWSESLFEQVVQIEQTIRQKPKTIFNFIPSSRLSQSNSFVMKQLFDVGATDYRSYHARDRVYPLQYFRQLKITKEDPLYSRKLLLKVIHNRYPVENIAVDFEVEKKTRSLGYYTRRYYYDFMLLAYSTLHRQNRPVHSALSFACGVFLACTPFYGLQTFLIIAVTGLSRLSFPVAFLGSQISLPPTYSLIVPLQIYVGFKITGMEPSMDRPWQDLIKDHFYTWTMGSLVVGAFFALLGGLLWFSVVRRSLKSNRAAIG